MNGVVVLVLLLLAVPLQLYFNHRIQQSYGATADDGEHGDSSEIAHTGINKVRQDAIENLGTSLMYLKNRFLNTVKHFSSWKKLRELFIIPRKKHSLRKGKAKTESVQVSSYKTKNGGTVKVFSMEREDSKAGEKVQKEKESKQTFLSKKDVEEYKMKNEYFAQSKDPRITRPPNVEYGIGNVLRHKQDGYHGVVIGWDTVAKAPDWWLEKHYKNREHIIKTPHYHLLLDSRFRAGTPYHYIPAEDLEPCNKQVSAPEVDKFFEDYVNGIYVARPWLRQIYPKD